MSKLLLSFRTQQKKFPGRLDSGFVFQNQGAVSLHSLAYLTAPLKPIWQGGEIYGGRHLLKERPQNASLVCSKSKNHALRLRQTTLQIQSFYQTIGRKPLQLWHEAKSLAK